MISYRPFLNGDVPAIVDIWRNNRDLPGIAKDISVDVFDNLVLSKPYFDRGALIVAVDAARPVGFVHAGFGPNNEGDALDFRRGVLSMLMTRQDIADSEPVTSEQIAVELLRQGEDYLRGQGAIELFAIGIGTLCPFYLGLYGGGDLAGVLMSDTARQQLFRDHEYTEVDRVQLYRRELAGYRPAVDRTVLQMRRSHTLKFVNDPLSQSWWEACTQGCFREIRADLHPKSGGPAAASAMFWNMEAAVSPEDAYTVGLSSVEVAGDVQKDAVAKYLLCESLVYLHSQGFHAVQGQAMQTDEAAVQLLESTGFTQFDTGTVLRKQWPVAAQDL